MVQKARTPVRLPRAGGGNTDIIANNTAATDSRKFRAAQSCRCKPCVAASLRRVKRHLDHGRVAVALDIVAAAIADLTFDAERITIAPGKHVTLCERAAVIRRVFGDVGVDLVPKP
jgi:hypothetical protein